MPKFDTTEAKSIARGISITDYVDSVKFKKTIETMYPGATPALVQSTMCHIAYEMGARSKRKYVAERALPPARTITVPMKEKKMNEIMTINNINCYEENGVAYLNLEACARGLGFTQIAASGNEVVRWETVRKYLQEYNVPGSWDGVGNAGLPEFIPENIFYRLAMKAKNEAAEKFQAKVADEIIPAIRKHGAYAARPLTPAELSLLQAQALVDIEKKQSAQEKELKAVSHRLDNMGDIISLNPQAWREEAQRMVARIAQALGGHGHIQDVYAEIYDLMLHRFGFDLKRRLNNKRGKMALEGANKTQQQKVTRIDVIAEDKKAIEAYLIIIKEMAIKYGVDKSA